jgi:hypothetical protein
MAKHEMQLSRLELKYIITEDKARLIRDFVRSYLELDEYCVGKPNLSYPIHSVYLDSDRLDLYWHSINGDKNRYKLRVRYYDERPNGPAFFELKRRVNDAILKQRAGVRREAVDLLLSGHLPEMRHLLDPKDTEELVAAQRFCYLMNSIRAKPKSHVAYLREAWVSQHDNSVRVTLDRQVQNLPKFDTRLTTQIKAPANVFGDEVVLELKFTGRFPDWFGEMTRVFNCIRCGAAKYVGGIDLLGREAFRGPGFANGFSSRPGAFQNVIKSSNWMP